MEAAMGRSALQTSRDWNGRDGNRTTSRPVQIAGYGIGRKVDLCKSPQANLTENRPVQLFWGGIVRKIDLCKSKRRNRTKKRPLQIANLQRSRFRMTFLPVPPREGKRVRRS